ncbi:hypothetical protein SNE40_022192 [Patella caerulea]|uniref:Uncharacterized protein n=1 Tax=Patella caerulea TaxID=87958 RepID=A0AAN8IXC2_PATCE
MCTLWLLSVAVVLASMLPSRTAVSGCKPAECRKRGGECMVFRCESNACGDRCPVREKCIHDHCAPASKYNMLPVC